jgi:hypothetical protein
MQRPDYRGGSIVNLMSTIGAAMGWMSPYRPLRVLRPADISTKNIVLVVLDAVGHEFMQRHGEDTFLKAHNIGPITSVMPSTTASAIPVFHSGLAPLQHGLTGWEMLLPKAGSVITSLKFMTGGSGASLYDLHLQPGDVYTDHHFTSVIRAKAYTVYPRDIVGSVYNTHTHPGAEFLGYSTDAGLIRQTVRSVRRRGRSYVFAYVSDIDMHGHNDGPNHPKTVRRFRQIDRAVASIAGLLQGTDTTIIVTSDHGMHSVKHTTYIEDHPGLADCLTLPACGEPRAMFLYVKQSRKRQFERYVRKKLSGWCTLHKSEDLLNKGFFGLGKSHPELHKRIGDYTLIMKEGHVIRDRFPGKEKVIKKGSHGGVSKQEMFVPLVIRRV